MSMSPRLLRPRASGGAKDADARTYIAAVELADGQKLEPAVVKAIDDFVIGCKADGIWTAIKASCILSGARTLSGALTALVGTAPTNVNFVSGDYNRKTGLQRAAGTRYLNTNRASNADPQDNYHASFYFSTFNVGQAQIGANDGSTVYDVRLYYSFGKWQCAARSDYSAGLTAQGQAFAPLAAAPALVGVRRQSSASFRLRSAGTNWDFNIASAAPSALNTFVFASNNNGTAGDNLGTNRLAFYSIGESLDLALLDTRVSALYTAIGAAI